MTAEDQNAIEQIVNRQVSALRMEIVNNYGARILEHDVKIKETAQDVQRLQDALVGQTAWQRVIVVVMVLTFVGVVLSLLLLGSLWIQVGILSAAH